MRPLRSFTRLALVMGSLLAGQAVADGGHIGWCTGVGNKHNAACAGTAGVPVVNGDGTPTTTASPGTQGAPTFPVASVSVPQPVAQPTLVPQQVPTPTPQAIPHQVPRPVAQPSLAVPTPNAIPTPTPVAVPPMVPQPVAQPSLVVPTPNAIPTPTPVAVPSQVPQLVAQPSLAVPTPNAIPTPTPVAVPSQVPQLVAQPGLAVPTPNAIPTPTPVAVPSQVPHAVSAPDLVPHQVPRPTPIRQPVKVPTFIAARPSGQPPTGQAPVGTPSTRPAIVTPLPGRQPAHALPVYQAAADAGRLTCLASGFGWRKFDDSKGDTRRVGLAPVLYTPDMLMHDLPANHPRHAECLIVVDRRLED